MNIADITLEEAFTQGKNLEQFTPDREGEISYLNKVRDREIDRGENTYLNKDMSGALQQQRKALPFQYRHSKEREPYSKVPFAYEYEIHRDREDNVNKKSPNEMNLTDNYRHLQRHETHGLGTRNVSPGARNVDSKARNVDNGARNVYTGACNVDIGARGLSPGARNLEQSSSDEERTDRMGQNIRTSPSIFSGRIDNPEGFQRPKPKYISQEPEDRSSLYRPQYLGNNVSGENSTNKQTPRQIPRQSQSESNLKSNSAPERIMYPVVKTFSDPVSVQAGQTRMEPKDEKYSSETSLVTNNVLGMERPLKSSENRGAMGLDRNEKLSPRNRRNNALSRRLGNKEIELGNEHSRDDFPLVDRQVYEEMHNRDTFQPERSRQPREGFNKAGASLETGKQPYEAKHTNDRLLGDRSTQNRDTSPSDKSSNRGRANDSFQDDKNTRREPSRKDTGMVNLNETEKPTSEVFGGLLGETDASHSAEYYDRMISKINEQINLAVSRNKSAYALYGLGSDDDDDWC